MDELILRKREYTVRAKQVLKRTAEDIVELSQICHEYHQEFGYQEYIRWVNDDLGLSKRHGCRLLNVYEKYGSSAIMALNFDPTAIYLLSESSTPESAREEVQAIHDSGEHISAKLAKEVTDRHKAELEATKKAAQQTITTLEDQIKALEDERTRLRAENNRAILTKQADDACIIRQEEAFERLTRQIEELKAKATQPQVIEKEVKVEVEKRIEVIPEDYDVLKVEVNTLREKLETTFKELDKVTKKLSKKEELLSLFGSEQKQARGLQKVSDGMKYIEEAYLLLKDQRLDECVRDMVEGGLQSLNRLFHNLFEGNQHE